jgi:hypothetical protein
MGKMSDVESGREGRGLIAQVNETFAAEAVPSNILISRRRCCSRVSTGASLTKLADRVAVFASMITRSA